jgi:hypothetical protein
MIAIVELVEYVEELRVGPDQPVAPLCRLVDAPAGCRIDLGDKLEPEEQLEVFLDLLRVEVALVHDVRLHCAIQADLQDQVYDV